jgi:Tfp pilus assembly protein FimT
MFEETKTAFVSTQNKATEEIKRNFLANKKDATNSVAKTPQKLQTVATPANKVRVVSSKTKQTQTIVKSKTNQQIVDKQSVSNNVVLSNEPATISKTTSKTYFANGLDYRTEEQVVQLLSSHIKF